MEEAVLPLSQQTLTQLSADNYIARSLVGSAQAVAYYTCANNTEAAIQSGLQASSLAQAAGKPALAISALGTTVLSMIGAGQLREALQLVQQAILLGKTESGDILFPEVGWPALLQADILREWNEIGRGTGAGRRGPLTLQADYLAHLAYLFTVQVRGAAAHFLVVRRSEMRHAQPSGNLNTSVAA